MSSSQQTLEFAFSAAIRKMVAKIGLLSVACEYGTDYAGFPQFPHLRESILGNVAENDFPLPSLPMMTSSRTTDEHPGSTVFAPT